LPTPDTVGIQQLVVLLSAKSAAGTTTDIGPEIGTVGAYRSHFHLPEKKPELLPPILHVDHAGPGETGKNPWNGKH